MPTRDRIDPAEPPLLALTTQQLAYLVAVADHDTFAEAAASVGVSTSALSQGVAELERRLGLDLFERVGRRQVLRDDAQEVLDHARRVVAETRDLARWVAAARSGRVGRLRVGMIDAAAIDHFHAVLRDFRRDAPEVELRLVIEPSARLIDQLVRGDLDLAVVVEPDVLPDSLDAEPLIDERIVVVPPEGVEPGHPSTWGPWVLFPTGSHTRAVVERELRARGVDVDVVAESHQPEVLREMARLGMGWTALPAGSGDVDAPELGRRRLILIRRRDRTSSPAADRLSVQLSARTDPTSSSARGAPTIHRSRAERPSSVRSVDVPRQ